MQSRSPLALIMLLLRGPNGWCASRAVAVGCLWSSRHCVLALYPVPADEVGHFFLFQKLNHRACAASSGYVTPDEPPSWSVSAIPGHSGQQCHPWRPPQGNTGGSQDCTRSYCDNRPGKAFLTVLCKISLREYFRSALEMDNLRQGLKAFA